MLDPALCFLINYPVLSSVGCFTRTLQPLVQEILRDLTKICNMLSSKIIKHIGHYVVCGHGLDMSPFLVHNIPLYSSYLPPFQCATLPLGRISMLTWWLRRGWTRPLGCPRHRWLTGSRSLCHPLSPSRDLQHALHSHHCKIPYKR